MFLLFHGGNDITDIDPKTSYGFSCMEQIVQIENFSKQVTQTIDTKI